VTRRKLRPAQPKPRAGEPVKLLPRVKFTPLDPGEPLMPTRAAVIPPGKFRDIPGQMTLDQMGAIELPEDDNEPHS
jgi:hypothetical protein